MDNKTILEAARNNGDRGNEYELKENIRASMISTVVLLVVGMMLFAIEYYVKGVLNVSLIILGVTVIGTDMFYRGITFKKLWRMILGSVLLLIALIMIIARVVL